MKKLLFLFTSIALFSCSKENEPEKTTNEAILGKWVLVSTADGGLIKTTPVTPGCGPGSINYKSDLTIEYVYSFTDTDNNCKTITTNNQDYTIDETPSTIYLTRSYYNAPSDKLKTKIKYKIVELSESKLTIQSLSVGHYKTYNGVSVYIVDEYEPINKTFSYYSKSL
jgi:hypothetical protein